MIDGQTKALKQVEEVNATVDFLKAKASTCPQVAIVLGSGLGNFADVLKDKFSLDYSDIPGFLECSVQGHQGQLHFGKIGNVEVVLMQGRFHFYEGYKLDQVVFPIKVFAQMGCEQLILTNAAGGIHTSYAQGQLVLIQDHINLTGQNPLVGKNIEKFGPRFPDMTYTYNPAINELFVEQAKELNIDLKTGIYAGVLGPTYETPAEVRMLKILGADLVGMSTVPEAIIGHHMGMKVTGISCVTNMAAGISKIELKHEDIKDVANKVMADFSSLVEKTIENKFPTRHT